MDEILMIDAVERYLKGEMTNEERTFFEDLRKNNSEVDQLVVEHSIFLEKLNAYGDNSEMQRKINSVHQKLVEAGSIDVMYPPQTSKGDYILAQVQKSDRHCSINCRSNCIIYYWPCLLFLPCT